MQQVTARFNMLSNLMVAVIGTATQRIARRYWYITVADYEMGLVRKRGVDARHTLPRCFREGT